MDRKLILGSIGILLMFSIALVGFFLVSEGMPDGLDRTLQEHGAGEESDPVWSAPLDYGSNYFTTLSMGIAGFIITLLVVYGVVKLRKSAEAE